ncbi:unnamed protein product [Urochloa decumbens]|uniref:Protein kinase domain-containing protein n=1 Tax=Urochloa decumbens TaxID=240449 RepID=A0ABC9GNH4_9POAL
MTMVNRRYGLCASHGFFFLLMLLPFVLLFSFLYMPLAAAATQSLPLNETQKGIMEDIARLVNSGSVDTMWDTTASNPCLWSGISCSSSGSSVTNITLSYYGISNSSIFASICRLDTLLSLDLSRNSLTNLGDQFSIPSCLMKEGLWSLNLSSNYMNGSLGDLSGFNQLKVLDLSLNYFSGSLSLEFSDFPQLRSLNLSSNKLIGDMPARMDFSLEELVLSCNQLTGPFPLGLFDFRNLTVLDLSQNSLTGGVPDKFSNLTKLQTLILSSNNLTGAIPKSLSEVTTLSRFAANENNLTGSIPLGLTKYLKMLDLSYNEITEEIPSDLLLGSNLETIDLTNNKLEGPIPVNISSSLYRLRLGMNNLSGRIPNSIGNASNLAYLELDNNNLEGQIPSNLGECKNLILLNLESNQLQGQVPVEIGNLKNLVALQLQMNKFIGTVPSTFSFLTNLTTLNLSYNSFSGIIQDDIMRLQKLSSMNLQANNISGAIPSSIFHLNNLNELNLGNNLLTGSIPEMPLGLSTTLNLSHNHLSGFIPSNIGFLSELGILDLSYNNLSGQVPSSFEKLERLVVLVLSYNQLFGSLPTFPPNVVADITGNPGLTSTNATNGNNIATVAKRKGHILLIVISAVGGALIGLVLLTVTVMFSLSNKTRRAEDGRSSAEEGATQFNNVCLITMKGIHTSAVEFVKANLDDWQIAPFRALNFVVADIPQGLTEENLIGSGGSGHVYRVTYTNRYNSRTEVVAVKQIQSVGWLDEKLEREFESEASILCNIRHKNIVKLLCCLSSAESKLLVYDYMGNGSLDRWLHRSVLHSGHSMARVRPVQHVPLDWPTRLIVAVGAAQGLCYMHHECSPPIVHRDVKASNILLDSEFKAKIADFGVARMLVRAGEPNTMSGVAGSFGYMAPECAYTRKVDEKVDVYGFGVVLLELTTGKKANDGGEHGSLAQWAEQRYRSGGSISDATDISIRYAGYTDEIETVFRLGVKCTGNSPSSRPTMKDVLQILLKCCQQTLRKSRMENSIEYEADPLLMP